jgi:hypothetical protein
LEAWDMKRRYRFLTLVLTIGMLFMNTEYAMAATGLSEAEESILDRLTEGVEMNGMVVRPPVSYLNQIENELIKNDMDITQEQARLINLKIEEAADLVKTVSMEEIVQFKNSDIAKKLIVLLEEVAEIANYTVLIDVENETFNVLDSSDNYVFMAKNVINQTGFQITPTIIVGWILISSLLVCFVIANKMKLFVRP